MRVLGSGPQTDKHLPQSPFTGKIFLDDDILLWYIVNLVHVYEYGGRIMVIYKEDLRL